MATDKTLEQIKAIRTAWPVFVFVATLLLNNLKTQNDIELRFRDLNYVWEKEVERLRVSDELFRQEADRINHRIDKNEQDLVLYYKRKPDVN
jgi:hypothetical protein